MLAVMPGGVAGSVGQDRRRGGGEASGYKSSPAWAAAATDARGAPNDLIAGTTPTPYGHDQETVGPRPKSGGLVGGEAGISSTSRALAPD
ncbi:hypothetical protein V8C26DRAFT_320157 [Trichoderma gracile]